MVAKATNLLTGQGTHSTATEIQHGDPERANPYLSLAASISCVGARSLLRDEGRGRRSGELVRYRDAELRTALDGDV